MAERNYKAVRREPGKPDVVTHFPHTASEGDPIRWCEAEGYKVVGHEIIPTPENQIFIATIIVLVQPKRTITDASTVKDDEKKGLPVVSSTERPEHDGSK